MIRINRCFHLGVGLGCVAMLTITAAATASVDGHAGATQMLNLGLRGVYFVPNQGQWTDTEVQYGLRSRGLDVAFRESSFTMHLKREQDTPCEDRVETVSGSPESSAGQEALTLGVTFPGSNRVSPEGATPQRARFNYFVGGQHRSTASNVPSFASVIYADLYDGIDLHVTGLDDGVLKYEFHVAPGADYRQIRIAYDGIESLCTDEAGDLRIETMFGTLKDGAPVVWQGDQSTGTIAARFELIDDTTYRIALDGPVDPTRELIIDPDVQWMTYLGGLRNDFAQAMNIDDDGSAFVTGWTASTDFEGRSNAFHGGDWDAFLVKVSLEGDLQWMTYFGGSEADRGHCVSPDADGTVLLGGATLSTDFAGRNNSHRGGRYDAYILRVDASGSLMWMYHLGGTGDDGAQAMVLDEAGNVFMTGETDSVDFDGRINAYHGGVADAFLVKVSPLGSVEWMSYLGGSAEDGSLGITLGGADSILLTGQTNSVDFAGRTNVYYGGLDIFVSKVGTTGSLEWMTYSGGSKDDIGYALVVDDAGSALVAAMTESDDFDGRRNSYYGGERDAVALKISAAGDFEWMLHMGGTGRERGRAIALDVDGGVFMTGGTTSLDFAGQTNPHYGGHYDAWVLRVSPDGLLDWMMHVGGTGDDWGRGLQLLDANHLVLGGMTTSPDFVGRNNTYRGANLRDSVVAHIRLAETPRLTVDATCPAGGPIRIDWLGATPGGQAALIYARETGAFRVPGGNPCAGTELGLGSNQIRVVWQGGTGEGGARTLNANAEPGACGGYLQLLDLTPCATSNVAPLE